MISAAVICFLKRSQKKRVSIATSREGGGAVGIAVERSSYAMRRFLVQALHRKLACARQRFSRMIWRRTCASARTLTIFPRFELPAWNAAATSVLLINDLTLAALLTYERRGIHETDKKEVDQTDAEDRADLFRVHLLRGCNLIERG